MYNIHSVSKTQMELRKVGISKKVIVQISESLYIINKYKPNSSSTGKLNTRELVRKYWSIFVIHIVLNSLSEANDDWRAITYYA